MQFRTPLGTFRPTVRVRSGQRSACAPSDWSLLRRRAAAGLRARRTVPACWPDAATRRPAVQKRTRRHVPPSRCHSWGECMLIRQPRPPHEGLKATCTHTRTARAHPRCGRGGGVAARAWRWGCCLQSGAVRVLFFLSQVALRAYLSSSTLLPRGASGGTPLCAHSRAGVCRRSSPHASYQCKCALVPLGPSHTRAPTRRLPIPSDGPHTVSRFPHSSPTSRHHGPRFHSLLDHPCLS